MSTFRFEELTCPFCGKTFSAKVVMSYSTNGSFRSLDGDPHVPEIFDMVHLCPHCGYAFSDPKAEIDAYTRMIVRSENYQKIFQAEEVPSTARKLLLSAFMAEQKEERGKAAMQYLHACWYFRDNNLPGKGEALEKTIGALERYLEANVDKNAAMTLVDLLRQKGAFDEAFETVNSLGKFLKGEETLLKVAAFEWRQIIAGDSKPHVLGEVGA